MGLCNNSPIVNQQGKHYAPVIQLYLDASNILVAIFESELFKDV